MVWYGGIFIANYDECLQWKKNLQITRVNISVITTQLPELPLLTITAKKAIQMQRYLDLFEVR